MGSCYPWRVINPTNPSNVFVLGSSLVWKCSLNCAQGSAQALLAQAWLCWGRGQGRGAHPACPLVSLSSSGHRLGLLPQPAPALSLGSSEEGAKTKIRRREVPCKATDSAEPMEAGCPRPCTASQGHLHNSQSLNQDQDISQPWAIWSPRVLVFIELFGLCDCALLQKRMSAFQGGCGEIQAYGKPSAQTKSEFSQNCPDLFAIILHHTQGLSNSGSFHSSASYLFIVLLLWLHSFPYEET